MTLRAGSRVGHYEVETLIGRGGMGEVFRAVDTRLHRAVALKVLPEALAGDPDRLARLRREAQILASLNHPNIAQVHGLEESDGVHAVAMELVEGPTLEARLAQGAMPVAEVLAIARQIADALEAAHDHGVVHRDLKPANIKVRQDGTAKILDFGLAKAVESAHTAASDHVSPTVTSPALRTSEGAVVGTPAYMSPEQARGLAVDRRTDLWSFGVILFEMLAGRRPFGGGTVTDVLVSVLEHTPDWSQLPAGVPAGLAHFVRTCLEKNAASRARDASLLRFALAAPEAPPGARVASARRSRIGYGVAAAVGVAVGALAVSMFRPDPSPGAPATVTRLTLLVPASLAGDDRSIAIARDGARVAYHAPGRLLVRALDRDEPVEVFRFSESPGTYALPFFSPDGQWLGFFNSNLELMKVPIAGGGLVRLTALDGGVGRGASWAGDDTIVFATSGRTGLQRVSADGGVTEALTTPDEAKGEADHLWPQHLPGGRSVLFTITSRSNDQAASQLAVLDLDSRTYRVVWRGGLGGRYLPTGHLMFASGGSILVTPFDAATLETGGASPVAVLTGVSIAPTGLPNIDVSDNGTLIYVPGGESRGRDLVWVDRDTGTERPLSLPPRAYLYPRLSPDERRIALDIRDQANDIWLWDLGARALSRLTNHEALDRLPVWAPDGRRVLFASDRDGVSGVYAQPPDGGETERLLQGSVQQVPMAVSRDGRRVVVRDGHDLSVLSLDGARRAEAWLRTPADEVTAALSPDDLWLAYGSNESGAYEIYVRSFTDINASRWQVSNSGGSQPVWSRDGRELFFFAGDGALMAVRVRAGDAWSASPPLRVVQPGYHLGNPTAGATYDVSRDGRRFLMIKELGTGTSPIRVTLNWFIEFERRAGQP